MTMVPSQIPALPTGMVMSPYYNIILFINMLVFAAILVWCIREARRSGSAIPVLIMIGAGIASLQECAFDVMVLVNWADSGHTPLYRIFDRSVPIWMLFAYPWFIGGQGYWMYRKLQQGMTGKQLWSLYFFAWFANLFLEVPALQLGNIYTYFGNQPFRILGFPLWMAWVNALMPILLASAVYAYRDSFTGVRSLLVLAVVPMAVGAAQIMIGWPIWLALNSGAGYGVTHAAAVISLGLSLIVVYLVGVKFCQPAEVRAHRGAAALSAS
jgi:lipoprotein signal peptidase